VPREGDLDLSGMSIPSEDFAEATAVRAEEWKEEIRQAGEFFHSLDPYMPRALELQRELLMSSVDMGTPDGREKS
jgi:phosphoenolpyruvate carboxykinase (GTP)